MLKSIAILTMLDSLVGWVGLAESELLTTNPVVYQITYELLNPLTQLSI
jgi:hypothetical protein